MSGSGGYYKYRCKNWLIYDCKSWVWVNNSACAHCLAEGRDMDDIDATVMPNPVRISREVYVPQLDNGSLHYTLMEIISVSDADSGWDVNYLPQKSFPIGTAPMAATFTAREDFDVRKRKDGFEIHANRLRFSGSGDTID